VRGGIDEIGAEMTICYMSIAIAAVPWRSTRDACHELNISIAEER
jgi:hypothetical protein